MAAVVASQHPGLWHHRTDQTVHIPSMTMSGLLPYDTAPRTTTNPPSARSYQPTTSHMDMHMPIFSTPMTTSVPYQSGAFAFESLSVNPYNMQQAFPVSYSQSIPQPVSYTGAADMQPLPTVREARNGFAIERTPPVKSESCSPIPPNQTFNDTAYAGEKRSNSESGDSGRINFSTDVDTLMRAIQAKQPVAAQQAEPVKREETKPGSKPKKRYQCDIPGCNKSFYQKTHLEIHTRAHTGVKPFLCKEPTCGQRFSQLGNLKTHERRHTGERPYNCDICGKTFAQRGNVRAHKIVHQQIKPFTCKLDECGKQFTQLGNLKSHQNKFHATTLRYLTQKFAYFNAGTVVTGTDKELFEYFASLYKNSNKGIKGRGKDRRISAAPSSAASSSASYTSQTATSPNRNYVGNFQHDGSDRSSRSSSMASDNTQRGDHSYDFNSSAMQTHGFPNPQGYDDMVFPERKLY
ncbi:zinc finger protein-like protein OZF [Lentithecium fluviatile CBS 122367]|uniref:Zinc finger protein-like protein OZF n=1 Tax=Lentithecium fluviatile CBS 122367 TaxID=1168545 RepID=A0A6G1IRX8_9PLEO|nr:zinc finger protein-like protein OZF [Lentithecium fluviatile CBS 122367]